MPPKKKKAKITADEEAEGPRQVKRQKTCPDCGATNVSFDPENEAMICGDCGAIFEEFVVIESKEEPDIF